MIAWLFGPVGKLVVAGVAILGIAVAIYSAGYRAASSVCQAELYKAERDAARVERDTALRDIAVARDAAAEAERLAGEADKAAELLQQKVDDYAQALPGDSACRATDDDVKRLRDIIGR